MKKDYLVVTCGILLLICIFQQWRIQTAVVPSLNSLPPPATTWDVKLLSQSIALPPGAKSVSTTNDSTILSGTTLQDSGFNAWLCINIKDVTLSAISRETRIAALAAHYADQIAAAIPNAVVAAGSSSESVTAVGNFHAMYLIEHPHGDIAVSAGYIHDSDGTPSDDVLICVLSRNFHKTLATSVGHNAGNRFSKPKE